MPIWLRNFTFSKIKDFYDKENEAQDPKPDVSNIVPKGPNIKPSVKPNYTVKAPVKKQE